MLRGQGLPLSLAKVLLVMRRTESSTRLWLCDRGEAAWGEAALKLTGPVRHLSISKMSDSIATMISEQGGLHKHNSLYMCSGIVGYGCIKPA